MKQGNTLSDDFSQLNGKHVGVQLSSVHDRFASEVLRKAGAQIVRYATLNEAYQDLIVGRLDAVQGDDIVLQTGFLDTPQGKGYAFASKPLTDPKYFGDGVGIAVRSGDTALAERFNKAIAAIRSDGEYQKINQHYFSFDIYGQ
jgi:arginine/ornithine transport system substrate-binding protein